MTCTGPNSVSTSIPTAARCSRQKNGGCARETFRAPQGQRMPAENGVAIMFVAAPHRRMEMPVPAQLLRDRSSLIDPGRSLPAQVEFLQSDDIDLEVGDHLRDPRLRALPIRPDAAVHVVGCDAQPRFAHSSLIVRRSGASHLRAEDRHRATLDFLLQRPALPILERDLARVFLVVIKNPRVPGDEIFRRAHSGSLPHSMTWSDYRDWPSRPRPSSHRPADTCSENAPAGIRRNAPRPRAAVSSASCRPRARSCASMSGPGVMISTFTPRRRAAIRVRIV